MTPENLEDPIELLVEMAKRGEIDPWNIDVIDVASKFLEKLEKAQKLDLRISGRVLLYAAILVRMKAEILANEALMTRGGAEEEVEEESYIPDEIDFDTFPFDFDEKPSERPDKKETENYDLPKRRTVRRFTTLDDLIKELEMAERVERRKRVRKKVVREVEDPLKVPHEENIEETLIRIEAELLKYFRIKDAILFSELVGMKERKEKVTYFLSILHLAYRKIIELRQERIFEEDIEIRLIR
ncbi:condensin subunit ScpA [Archaeoglobus sulfaticallidus PM70-1]|uniref:Condensin subunit ScpA n=1 Tax=Archaeoglobus sulfaticallidus PM70-1 TaxID=387631 RepID=N0BJV5_9EURY|nr:ScpA family protein [Archaeoglobus sulfaticallidus]AGK60781.1 condensin subunit ScpA [Archaeoglobus sulfaticallidus PM70-1]